MKKKIIPVIVALVLILIIALVGFGGKILDKYSYSKELADLNAYFGVGEGELAIVLQDEMVEQKALLRDNAVYFDIDTIELYLNEGFYADVAEQKLLYTTANDTVTTAFGGKEYSDKTGSHPMEHATCLMEGERLYVAADYVKLFANFSYTLFDRHIQMDTRWGENRMTEVVKNTQLRSLGGIKSPILRELEKGETVEVLNQMETWSEVKTWDSLIGYVENKCLGNEFTETQIPVTDYVPAEYTSLSLPGKVNLGFHAIGGEAGNDTLDAMVAEGKGINVIAPTWFSLNDNEGNFRSYADRGYVDKAHGYGLSVWGVWDNFNYRNETGADISTYQILSSTAKRQQLVRNMVDTSLGLGLDGINIDYEGLPQECGEHYVQFLKELSVACREKGLILSIDSYVPFNFNNYYRLDIQGQVADYVIIMGYDEHWHGSGDPGSVASISYVSNGLDRTLNEENVPPEKIVNALPFYTILWQTEGANVTDQYITLNNVTDYLQRMNVQPAWDEATCQNYAEWKSGNVTYQIWVEDAESIAVKLNVMKTKNIGGVAVWRLGYGTEQVWDLVSAYANS